MQTKSMHPLFRLCGNGKLSEMYALRFTAFSGWAIVVRFLVIGMIIARHRISVRIGAALAPVLSREFRRSGCRAVGWLRYAALRNLGSGRGGCSAGLVAMATKKPRSFWSRVVACRLASASAAEVWPSVR